MKIQQFFSEAKVCIFFLSDIYRIIPDQKYATGKVHKNNTIMVGIPHLNASVDFIHLVLLYITAANGVAPGVKNAK